MTTTAASSDKPRRSSRALRPCRRDPRRVRRRRGTNALASQQIAGNFQSFLQLLTTQLQNQNPLDPLDTNQFTQQLVEFAGVQQQLNTNDSLATLVSLQQTTQSTQALGFVGKTAVVKGGTAPLTNSTAAWQVSIPTASVITVNIANSTGQTVFTGSIRCRGGQQPAVLMERPGQ